MPDAQGRDGASVGPPAAGPPNASRPGEDAPGGDPVAELIARLRGAGLDPDGEQLCDALWLARWTRTAEPEPPGEPAPDSRDQPAPRDRTTTAGNGPVPADPPLPADQQVPAPLAPQRHDGGGDRRVALFPLPQPGERTTGSPGRAAPLPVGVPAATALPAPLELQRALRPLQRYRSPAPPLRTVLDETETAQRSALAGLVTPVFRGVTRADARLQLVMDASSSMRVWDRMFAELEQIFGRLGAFWDIQVSHLHEGPDGRPAVSRSPDRHALPLHSVDRLNDPTGRRLTLLVSDCVGPLWRSGQAHRLLHHLSRQAAAAVLQPLPQRMWQRTRLPVSYGELTRGEGLGGAAALRVRSRSGTPVPARPGMLPVPVIPPEPAALGAWARLLSRTGAGTVTGAIGWVSANQPPAPAARPGRRPSGLELVSRFRSNASTGAGRLAVYLAAAPLCLPVMQLVQRTMLPDSGPAELAEVLLGGLVSRTRETNGSGGPQWYEFAPGVQESLLAPLGRDEAVLILKHCSQYIEGRFAKGGPNFPALALAQLGGGSPPGPYARDGRDLEPAGDGGETQLVPQPFAEVAARVLERFMPLPEQFALYGARDRREASEDRPVHPAVARARSLVERFDGEGMVQDLIDAVQLLRRATEQDTPDSAAAQDFELWGEYGQSVLRLWEVQGGPELLAEAEQAAGRAVAHPRGLRERAVLARVLRAGATDHWRHGDRRQALELLGRADREYAVACSAPGLDESEVLRLTLERVSALESRWRLGGDSSQLQAAVGMLEAYVDAWPDRDRTPAEILLAHGRVLLRLSGATSHPEQARRYAEQSAGSLREALDHDSDSDAARRVHVLIDLVDAILASGGVLDDASSAVEEGLGLAGNQHQRARLEVRAGRIAVAAYAESGGPRELHAAARHFEQAAQRMSRDAAAHADVLAEWGEVLLRRVQLGEGIATQDSLSRAISVLRDCRAQTSAGSAHLARRLLLLGRALMLRYGLGGERVDLREAEHLLGLAAAEAEDALLAAQCWLELGQAQFEAYASLGRTSRLDEAVDAFRAAAESARRAQRDAATERREQEAARLEAQAHHLRGMSYEAAARPRSAREAYREARTRWARLPDHHIGTSEPTAEQTALRLAELE
ncbi:hypothetical protein DSC45_15595 [Streptomyces sp. YIM 130001]|uniref:SAV_2336 N-terminal domain-related protein n=1 Tax=Streptomyces sp. YIM 130001 TaxID=2259644 RepID=UPI000EEC6F46|nr:SAV_2336 N-terminal domain-related protein [Streptomyces sp. YIM 130001]RII16010.1 hypothetical protein DSC45_15595 [Streptomyces sp. YIM 130001]